MGGTKPSHSVGESSSASFDDAERSTPQDTASDSRTQPGLGTAVPTARPLGDRLSLVAIFVVTHMD